MPLEKGMSVLGVSGVKESPFIHTGPVTAHPPFYVENGAL